MNQSHANAQAAEQRDIEQQVREVIVLDHCAIESDHENPVAEPGNVSQYLAEICESFVHRDGCLMALRCVARSPGPGSCSQLWEKGTGDGNPDHRPMYPLWSWPGRWLPVV